MNIEKWYRGYNSKYGSDRTFVLWLTDDIDYARSYGNRVEEIMLDSDKVSPASIDQMDSYCERYYEYDSWDGPTKDAAAKALADGFNCNLFEANEDCSLCMCLWSKEPIVSRRELSREEFDAIEGYEGFDNPSYDTQINEGKEMETTYYRFQSEVRAFLSKLLKNPVDAQPSKYLKDRDFTRKKLIDELLKRDVLERHEKILDRTNSDEKDAKYVVKFKVHRKDFEKRIHRIYIKYFEKNINEEADIRSCANLIGIVGGGKPGDTADRWAQYINRNDNGYNPSVFENEEEMKKKMLENPADRKAYMERGGIKEEAGVGAAGAAGMSGVAAPSAGESASTPSNPGSDPDEKADGGRGAYSHPVFPMQRRTIGVQGDIKTKNPVLGKNLTAESKKSRRIFVTEEQWSRILKEEGIEGVADTSDGMLGTIKPGKQFQGANGKSNDKFMKPAMDRTPGGICVNQMDDKK